jgi:hypothetical protein
VSVAKVQEQRPVEPTYAGERLVLRPVVDRVRLEDANGIFQHIAAERAAGRFVEFSRQPHAKFARADRPVLIVDIDLKASIAVAVGVVPQLGAVGKIEHPLLAPLAVHRRKAKRGLNASADTGHAESSQGGLGLSAPRCFDETAVALRNYLRELHTGREGMHL